MEAAAQLDSLDRQMNAMVLHAVEGLKKAMAGNGKPEDITLLRYRNDQDLAAFRVDMAGLPASAHGALIGRVRAAFADFHVPTRIVYMAPAQYRAWLGDREDTEETRAHWAQLQP